MHVRLTSETGEAEGFLVDVLPARIMPDPELVKRYYGDKAPAGAFCALVVGRFVFRVTGRGYYVVAASYTARRFWRFYETLNEDVTD